MKKTICLLLVAAILLTAALCGVTVLFDAEMRPDYAEIDREGKGVLFIDVTEFA